MKHLLIFSLLTVSIIPFQSMAQKESAPGFLGKKIVLDVSGVVHPHIIYNLISEQGFNSNLRPKKDWWDFGFKGGIGYNVRPQLMIGFQFSYLKQSSIGPDYIYNSDLGYTQSVIHEMLDYNSKSFALKFEFTGQEGLLPVGFSHGLSAGITINSLVNRNYAYRYYYDDQVLSTTLENNIDVPKEFSLTYTANMRQPLSKNVAINYGLGYSLNFMSGGIISQIYGGYYNDIIEDLSRNRRFSIMTAHVGLSIIL
jgi:hypothetical protein